MTAMMTMVMNRDMVVVVVDVRTAIAANVVRIVVVDYVVVVMNVDVVVTVDINVAIANNNIMARLDVNVVTRLNINVMLRLDNVVWLACDHCRLHDGLRRNYALRRGDNDLVEERLAMAKAIEVQSIQAAPGAFEDEELLLVVVAPVLADLVAAGIDDLELISIAQRVGVTDVNADVQILLRTCFRGGSGSRMGLIEPRDARVMPWLAGLRDSEAAQHQCCRK
jgi:hypothetical protein